MVKTILQWIDDVPWIPLVLLGGFLALAPFTPQPHAWEKIGLLMAGQLTRPLDMFDLLYHGLPLIIMGIKLQRQLVRTRSS